MYIFFSFADIIFVLIYIIIYILIILPLVVKMSAFLNINSKRLCLTLYIFNIKITDLLFELTSKGFYLYYFNSYKFFKFKNLINMKGSFQMLNDFSVTKINSLIEVSSENDLIKFITISYIYMFIITNLGFFLKINKPYIKFENGCNIIEKESNLLINLDLTIIFNLISLISTLIKLIIRKIQNAKRKNSQQNITRHNTGLEQAN